MNNIISIKDDNSKPFFLITIDVEGDNLWTKHRKITTQNADFLPRFQSLCESYGFKPTYLTDYEMGKCSSFQDFGREIIKNRTGEIGMHLHAWNTLPLKPLTEDDFVHVPYLIEYPVEIIKEKITSLTTLLEDVFKKKIVSHRAGRWGFNETYARILVEHGYKVDCSVTPHVSWRSHIGDPNQYGGTDFTHFPDNCYFLDLNNISRPGDSTLLEVPVTIILRDKPLLNSFNKFFNKKFKHFKSAHKIFNQLTPTVIWFRPKYEGSTIKNLLQVLKKSLIEKRLYVEFMLHSFDLMPGVNPLLPKEKHIDALYKELKLLFHEASHNYRPATLAEFYDHIKR